MFVESLGYEAQTAHSGENAIEAVKTFLPHLVILDLGLPDMNGSDVAAEIKTLSNDVLLVAQTGTEPGTDNSVFDCYLVKPVRTKTLEETLSRLLSQ